jgi:hypothetical protein
LPRQAGAIFHVGDLAPEHPVDKGLHVTRPSHYQAQASIADASTAPGGQCYFNFPQVPDGKRLRLTSVSAQLGPAANDLDLQSGAVAYFVTKADPASSFLQSVVSFYFEPKSTPVAHVFVGPNYTQHTSLIVTLVGVLETA